MPSILDDDQPIDPADEASLLEAINRAAKFGTWQASAWILSHHPMHRQQWGDHEWMRRMLGQQLAKVVDIIERSQALNVEQRMVLLTELAAAGLTFDGLVAAAEPAAEPS